MARSVHPHSASPAPVDPHAPLREDVRLLGDLLGRTLREHFGLPVPENRYAV